MLIRTWIFDSKFESCNFRNVTRPTVPPSHMMSIPSPTHRDGGDMQKIASNAVYGSNQNYYKFLANVFLHSALSKTLLRHHRLIWNNSLLPPPCRFSDSQIYIPILLGRARFAPLERLKILLYFLPSKFDLLTTILK